MITDDTSTIRGRLKDFILYNNTVFIRKKHCFKRDISPGGIWVRFKIKVVPLRIA